MCVLYNVSPAQAEALIITLPEMPLSLDIKSKNKEKQLYVIDVRKNGTNSK